MAYINTDIFDCRVCDGLASSTAYMYQAAVNKGLKFDNIGFTGIDNGLITYDKTTLTNEAFWDIFTNSTWSIQEGDKRFFVRPVGGNNQLYDYPVDVISLGGQRIAELNGGFYQGFFRVGNGCDYNVLPSNIGEGWSMEFVINPTDSVEKYRCGRFFKILNDVHPENKGLFFYIGTRAENKWVRYYSTECEFDETCYRYSQSEFFNPGYIKGSVMSDSFFGDEEYLSDTAYNKKDMEIIADGGVETEGENPLNQPNIKEIETDNKFIFFDRSKDGVTTRTWTGDETWILKDVESKDMENFFILANRTKEGMRVRELEDYKESKSKEYSLYDDLFRNAFAFFVDNNGAVGYKYMVRDCDNECGYNILTEKTNNGVVPQDKWSVVHTQFIPVRESDGYSHASDKMVIRIYVDGMLRLQSKELPVFDLRPLNDTDDKQEGVAFNISLGGGTQGLADVVYEDFMSLPTHIYPLEKEFGGSLIGYFKSFKFYDCLKDIEEIRANYQFEKDRFPRT